MAVALRFLPQNSSFQKPKATIFTCFTSTIQAIIKNYFKNLNNHKS